MTPAANTIKVNLEFDHTPPPPSAAPAPNADKPAQGERSDPRAARCSATCGVTGHISGRATDEDLKPRPLPRGPAGGAGDQATTDRNIGRSSAR